MRLVLTNCNLIDCVSPTPVPEASIVVENGLISEILDGNRSPDTRDAEVIDLEGRYLLPGLWDIHIHPEHTSPAVPSVAEQTARFGRNLMEGLTQSGVVGVRTGGAANFMDVAWKRTFSTGQMAGPQVFACGHFLTTTGGHFLTSGHARECDGPYGFVQAIREQMKNGVDHIKLNLSGGIMGPAWDRHHHSFLLREELEAAFAICNQRDFKVMAHATNPDAVKTAARLGAHTVEHGYIMDEECVQTLLEHDTWYVPTLAISHLTPEQVETDLEKSWVERRAMAPDLIRRADAASGEHKAWFQTALNAGVKMALGSDIIPLRESALLEMGLWVKDGATPWQALQAATTNAAQLCGVGDDHGTVEVGKVADLLVVSQSPLEDIQNLQNPFLVLKNGRIVADMR